MQSDYDLEIAADETEDRIARTVGRCELLPLSGLARLSASPDGAKQVQVRASPQVYLTGARRASVSLRCRMRVGSFRRTR